MEEERKDGGLRAANMARGAIQGMAAGGPLGAVAGAAAADGAAWYKQYARPTVERTPYYESDGSVEFHSSIVQRMPRAPQRKERL